MSNTGKRLIEAAREARAIARGETKPAHIYALADNPRAKKLRRQGRRS